MAVSHGAGKARQQRRRERLAVASCAVDRLVRRLGLRGVNRGKAVRTTMPDAKTPCPLDRVNRIPHILEPAPCCSRAMDLLCENSHRPDDFCFPVPDRKGRATPRW
jgi:hypothetical protein